MLHYAPNRMRRSLLDTDIFSVLLKRSHSLVVEAGSRYLQDFGTFTITTITVMEMVSGFQQTRQPHRIQDLTRQIEGHELLTMTAESSFLAGHIYGDLERHGLRIGVADTVIAAIAIDCGLQLVSGNTKHYQRIIDLGYSLDVANWRDG